MPRRRRLVILVAALLCCLGAAGEARAQTTLHVRLGWDGWVNAGRWNPAFVTLSDPRARNVSLELHVPYDNYHTLRFDQSMTIGPQPQTFPLFLPLRNIGSDDVSVIVRDAVTRKRLAVYPSPEASYRGGTMTDPSRQFIGVSGNRTTLRALTDALPGAMLQAGYLDPAELPTDLIGYDCLDILLLNAPNPSALSVEQHQAIADWVRGGGNLILWPSEDPVPAAGPLVDLLPCRIRG